MEFNLKDNKKNKLYNYLWRNITNDIVKTKYYNKISNNSYSFKKNDKESLHDCLIRNFKISDTNLFKEKFRQAISGSGKEDKKILTLHSSSLCALMFFYKVSCDNPLILKINNQKIKFIKSIFEYQNKVLDNGNPSNIDVTLYGYDIKTKEEIILFLESKFAEFYYGKKKSYKVKSLEEYLKNDISKKIYDKINEVGYTIDKENNKIISPDNSYIDGIKQMISHYVGVRNFIKDNKYKEITTNDNQNVKVYLGEILFDAEVLKDDLEEYELKYVKLAKILNEQLKSDKLNDKFEVLSNSLHYSMFKYLDYEIDDEVKKFYFRKDDKNEEKY